MNMISYFFWLLKKEKYKCPRCNYPIFNKKCKICDNCGQPLLSQ